MNILIAGTSGFIGTELVKALQPHHTITVLGRNIHVLQKKFSKNLSIKPTFRTNVEDFCN